MPASTENPSSTATPSAIAEIVPSKSDLAKAYLSGCVDHVQDYFGDLLRGIDIPFLTGSKKKKGRGNRNQKPDDPAKNQPNQRGGGGRGRQLEGQDLDIQFNFSLRDDVTYAHRLDEGIFEPTRGNYQLSLSPSAEYQINRRLSLRLFFDYRRSVPKTSAGFPRTDTAGGIVVRFSLN